MIREEDLLEARISAMRDLPWPIPALVIIEFSDADLDRLEAVEDSPAYWTVLNGIVRRIEAET